MSAQSLVAVIESISCIALLIVLLSNLWPSLREDTFRQSLFSVRDEMFDYALSGSISFDDPAYKLLRQSMNGFLRFAHRLTLFRLCLTIFKWRMSSEAPELRWQHRWSAAMERLPEDVRMRLNQFHSRALSLVIKRLVLGSPMLITILVVVFTAALVKRGLTNLRQGFREAAFVAVSHVVDPRMLEEEAARLAA